MHEIDTKIIEELGNPIMPEPSENFYRVRRNCLIGSGIILLILTLVYFNGGENKDSIDVELPFIKIKGIKFNEIWLDVFFLQFYLFFHFIILVFIHLMEIRIRITGTFAKQGNFIQSDKQDSKRYTPKEISKFLNLYNWWSTKAEIAYKFEKNEEIFNRIESEVLEFKEKNKNDPNILGCIKELQDIKSMAQEANKSARDLHKIIKESSPTILPRLQRFDEWTKKFNMLQITNLIAIEILTPLILSALSLALLVIIKFSAPI